MMDIFTKLARCHSAEEVQRMLSGNGAVILSVDGLDEGVKAERNAALMEAVLFFLEEGIAEDHPDLNTYAYDKLTKAYESAALAGEAP